MSNWQKLKKDNHWLHIRAMDHQTNQYDFLVREAEWQGDVLSIQFFENGFTGRPVYREYHTDALPIINHNFIKDGSVRLAELVAAGAIQDAKQAPSLSDAPTRSSLLVDDEDDEPTPGMR